MALALALALVLALRVGKTPNSACRHILVVVASRCTCGVCEIEFPESQVWHLSILEFVFLRRVKSSCCRCPMLIPVPFTNTERAFSFAYIHFSISGSDVCMYAGLPLVVKGLNVDFPGGCKVGIAGRTGAGKVIVIGIGIGIGIS